MSAGVGKGRQIAGLILEHKRTGGKRTLWVSVSNDLRFDAKRDLSDLGAEGIAVWPEVPPPTHTHTVSPFQPSLFSSGPSSARQTNGLVGWTCFLRSK